ACAPGRERGPSRQARLRRRARGGHGGRGRLGRKEKRRAPPPGPERVRRVGEHGQGYPAPAERLPVRPRGRPASGEEQRPRGLGTAHGRSRRRARVCRGGNRRQDTRGAMAPFV
ncbi:MAG: hypothetical protein AVDCRST_MAG03-409, partial [uncultured Rubrobacteraceae bacterium]